MKTRARASEGIRRPLPFGSSYSTDRKEIAPMACRRRVRPWATLAALVALGILHAPSRAAWLGDLDGDGRVTLLDAAHLLEVTAGIANPTARDRFLGHLAGPAPKSLLPDALPREGPRF